MSEREEREGHHTLLTYIYTSLSLYIYSYKYIMLYTDGTYYNDVWISNDLGASWQLSTGNGGWAARSHMAAVYVGGTIILMGGSGEYVYM